MSRHIAFLSDIHGNLTALQAVLSDIQARGITEVYFLGDVLGRGPAVHELISLIRTHCKAAVYGNWDTGILNDPDHSNPIYTYYTSRMTQEEIDWLLSLPETLELDFCGHSMIAYHGRQSVSRIYIPTFASDQTDLDAALERFGRHDLTILGDAHHAYHVVRKGQRMVGIGAVGTPTDGLPLASYLIVHGDEAGGMLSTEQVRIRYDIEKEVSRALHTPDLPFLSDYITEISTGYYCRKARDAYYAGRQK